MKISIKREGSYEIYDVPLQDVTLLEILNEIKSKVDATLAYSSGCRSSVCGSCAVRVNGKEVLACSYKAEDGDVVEPLLNVPIERDLVVNMDKAYGFNSKAKAYQSTIAQNIKLSDEDEKRNALQSDCILCSACYSACPVYAVNKEFLGPFSLTRVWRYVSDKREENPKDKIGNIQMDGVWDCTLCNACTLVCPQGISSKADIEKLRARSVMFGYSDPSFGSFDGGFSFDGSPSF
ncbi:MAG TPA: 2Fe-2S iron-sulfur cluster-binding protein [Sulfurimonas sp.]|uniref:succinate dehydrogenase/fumarate reductase iron-sulfur subunit n=1 Tax=Sulfurimonas sp. TaxID=2022749 RepID=UPI002CCD6D2C|nr:2Fe-2S iron-sulfur cluster-binding protein [Sulfurimonas sp.]HUH42169.1 2Fe-2S iron-sulfur cluster-binding protein [Sulfurimonas sp.]